MTSPAARLAPPGWRAIHIHYHADLDRLLLDFVPPLLGQLARDHDIDRFFFVRYSLGGPHLRLRIRARDDRVGPVCEWILAQAENFLARHPSRCSLSEEQVRSIHDSIVRADPEQNDATIYPDNLARQAPFDPETERYGGLALLDHALDYFVLSSAGALDFLAAHGDAPRARQLPIIMQIVFADAWSFARDLDELLALLSFAVDAAGPSMAAIVERGDRLFEQRRDVFVRLLQTCIEAPQRHPGATLLHAAVQPAPLATRLRALSSQLHMTANRLGLSNAEEVYIGRVLWRATRACQHDMLTQALDRRQRARPDTAGRELGQLATAALTRYLTAAPG